MRKVLVLNGPNLGRLGQREKSFYGDLDYEALQSFIAQSARAEGLEVDIRQSDDESTLIRWIHEAVDNDLPVIFNPAAFTHYSVALRDACAMLRSPLIEVHLSNPLSREEFRHTSLISGVSTGTISGFKQDSYRLALIAMNSLLQYGTTK